MPYRTFATGEVLTASNVNSYLMTQAVARVTSSTRPSSPSAGQRIWETDTNREMIYNGSSWVFYKGIDFFVFKTVDESLASSQTNQDDNDFINIPFDASATYMVNLWIVGRAATAANWNWTIVRQTGTTSHFLWWTTSPHSSAVDSDHVTLSHNALGYPDSSGGGANMQGFGGDVLYPLKLTIRSTTAGTFKVQWSQRTSNATANLVRAGSYIYGQRVA